MLHSAATIVSHATRGWQFVSGLLCVRGFRPWFTIVLMLGAVLSAPPARAQIFERATVIQNARFLTMNGDPIENGVLVMKGGRIEAIGSDVKPPMFSRVVDGQGMVVTPGLIDAWSALGRLGNATNADPTARATDAYDGYATDDFLDALQNGITTMYLGPDHASGIGGMGSVIHLSLNDNGKRGSFLNQDAALCINLASGNGAVARARLFQEIRKQFKTALDYREALEDYEEELKEYVKKLEERAAKEKAKKDPAEDTGAEAPAEPKKEGDTKPSDEKSADGREGQSARGRGFEPSASQPPEPEPADRGDKKSDSKKDDAKEELKKPVKPALDRASEVLLTSIDHKVPVRITAHRSADILNALALAEEFNLDLTLEGATEAHLLAGCIAEAEVPVILGPVVRTGLYEPGEHHRHDAGTPSALSSAGVAWTVGSGGSRSAHARFAGFNAQLATSNAAAKPVWLERMTRIAAELLGVSSRVGRLAPGMSADLVVWSGDPGDPASRVLRVFVAGTQVYESSATAAAEDES